MGRELDLVSAIVIVVIVIGNYLLLQMGVINMTLLGEAIAGGSVVAIIAIFWGTWGGRIKRSLKGQNKPEESSKSTDEKEELEKLIKPLYCEFDKYQDMPNEFQRSLIRPYHGLALALSTVKWFDPNSDYAKSYGADKVEFILNIFRMHVDLAQPQLKELIHQYLKKREVNSKQPIVMDRDFKELYDISSQIDALVKARYNELVWKD